MRYILCYFVAVLATALPVICHAEVINCFSRGVFDVNAALDDFSKGLSFQPYAPHGAQVNDPEDQFSVDENGVPYSGFSVDLDTSQYRERAGEEWSYRAVISKHEDDVSIFVARVVRGDFDPQNLSITITLPSLEFVEVDRFLSLEEMRAHGYSVPQDAETMPGRSAINVIWFGNCRRSE